MGVVVPTEDSIKSVVGGLFDKELEFEAVPCAAWNRLEPVTMAIYASDDGKPLGIFLCDVGLAAHAAAALVLLPATKSAMCAEGGYIDDELLENFHEVANVASGLFNSPSTPRVALRDLLSPPVEVPRDARPILIAPSARIQLEMSIEGYGKGRMTLLCA